MWQLNSITPPQFAPSRSAACYQQLHASHLLSRPHKQHRIRRHIAGQGCKPQVAGGQGHGTWHGCTTMACPCCLLVPPTPQPALRGLQDQRPGVRGKGRRHESRTEQALSSRLNRSWPVKRTNEPKRTKVLETEVKKLNIKHVFVTPSTSNGTHLPPLQLQAVLKCRVREYTAKSMALTLAALTSGCLQGATTAPGGCCCAARRDAAYGPSPSLYTYQVLVINQLIVRCTLLMQ
jgi:hypothetical protein